MNEHETYWLDRPGNVKRLLIGFHGVCAALLMVDFLYHRHAVHPWDSLWGFYAFYGFVACVVLVLAAKGLRKLVMRGERYYEDDE